MKRAVLLLGICVCSSFHCLASNPSGCPHLFRPPSQSHWTWTDRDHKQRTRAELDVILVNHKKWVEKYSRYATDDGGISEPKAFLDPLRADLSGANLMYAELRDVDLEHADMSGANLIQADLTHADLYGANLDHVNMPGCLVNADVRFADFTGAKLFGVNFTKARLHKADFTGGANLQSAILTGADLENADLSGANLQSGDLSGAFLTSTELDNVNVSFAKFWNTYFEPTALPLANSVARAEGLRTLRWRRQSDLRSRSLPDIWANYLAWLNQNPDEQKTVGSSIAFLWQQIRVATKRQNSTWPSGNPVPSVSTPIPRFALPSNKTDKTSEDNSYPILDLRKSLHDAGYRDAELEVNLAYQRGVQSTWQMVLLDWTCEWGANWHRPIGIAAVLGMVCAVIYWYLIRFTRRNRLSVVGVLGKDEKKIKIANLCTQPRWTPAATESVQSGRLGKARRVMRAIRVRLRWEWKVASTALLFSAMSVLNLGVQGLDLGRWIRLMQRREFDLRSRGTIRVLAGVQSIVSFVLLALATLSYFRHSFE